MDRRARALGWALLSFAVLALTSLSLFRLDQWTGSARQVIIATIVVIWLGLNRTHIGPNDNLTFIHSISLLIGLTLGVYPAIISTAIGVLISVAIERALNRCSSFRLCAESVVLIGSRQLMSLAGGLAIYRLLGGKLISGVPSIPETFPTISLAISFSVLFVSLHAVQRWLQSSQVINRRDSTFVSLIALIPIPFTVIGTVAFSVFSEAALLIYGAMVILVAPAFRILIELQTGLTRKTRALSALLELASSQSSVDDGKNQFALIDLALNELGSVDRAALLLNDPSDQRLQLVHTYNLPSDQTARIEDPAFVQLISKLTSGNQQGYAYIADFSSFPPNIGKDLDLLDIDQIAAFSLRGSDQNIGQIWLFFQGEQKHSAAELNQLRVFINQLSKSVELSREIIATNNELNRRVEQLARLESIGRQVTASIAIADVYETILFHGIQATSATEGHLELLNVADGRLEVVASDWDRLDDPDWDAHLTAPMHQLAQRAFETGQVTNIPDARKDPEFGDPTTASLSLLFTPIISNGETMGVIALGKEEPGGFVDEEEAFVIQLASHAANAIRNAMMYEELEERLKEQSLLYQASAQIAESLDTQTVSLALADSLAFAINADAAFIYRYSQQGEVLEFIIGVDGKRTLDGSNNGHSLGLEIPGVKASIENRQPIQWSSSDAPTGIDAAHLDSLGGGTILLLPLIVGERTLGLATLIRHRDERFQEEEVRTAQSIAIQASIVLENSDLFQQISQSNYRLSAVLNSTREGMLMIDKDGKIAVLNTQLKDLIHIDPDILTESSFLDLEQEVIQKLGYKREEIDDLVASLRSGKGHLPGVSTYELSKEEHQVLRRLETPVYDSAGKLIGWLIVIRDVSEEIQLEESRKHLTEMIVHDLRSPLSAILNSMELLRMQLENQEKSPIMQQALAIADRSVHQMLGLVNALLDLSKLESGQFVLARNELIFQDLVPHLIDTFLPEAEQAGVILDYQVDPDLPAMMFDEEKLFRVLSNLLDNALKFTPAGGKVTLEMAQTDGQLFIDVRDTGPGVPMDFRDQIFDLYAQVPGTEGRRRGTGLGLAFCKLAIEAHQGEIWVEDNPGGGSRFRIRLPISAE